MKISFSTIATPDFGWVDIYSMAKDLGITSVTEGVETETQYHALKEMGCEIFQGYYFSKPIPVEEFEAKL